MGEGLIDRDSGSIVWDEGLADRDSGIIVG